MEANGSFVPPGEPTSKANRSPVPPGEPTLKTNESFVPAGEPPVPLTRPLVPPGEPPVGVPSPLVPPGEPPVGVPSPLVPPGGPPVGVPSPLVPPGEPSVRVESSLVPAGRDVGVPSGATTTLQSCFDRPLGTARHDLGRRRSPESPGKDRLSSRRSFALSMKYQIRNAYATVSNARVAGCKAIRYARTCRHEAASAGLSSGSPRGRR